MGALVHTCIHTFTLALLLALSEGPCPAAARACSAAGAVHKRQLARSRWHRPRRSDITLYFECHACPHRLREAFPAGLATSRADFERQLAALPQPDLASLGDYVMRTDLKHGGAVEVKQAMLCSAHPSIQVRRQCLPHIWGDPATRA